jgi:hypothetical protein
VDDAAVLDQRRGDEQPVVARLLDERHDGRQPACRAGETGQARVVEPHRDFRGEILQLVPRQAELREDDEPGPLLARPLDQVMVPGEVLVQLPENGGDLGERDPERRHCLRAYRLALREPRLAVN